MSWKLRRAHYYQSQRGGGGGAPDPKTAKLINFFLLIGIVLIFIFLVIVGGNTDFEEDSILGVLLALGGLSLLITPFLFILACLANTFSAGLPNIAQGNRSNRTQKVNRSQGEHIWNQWIEEDKKKKEKDFHKENLDKWLEKNQGKKIFNRQEAELKAMDYHNEKKSNSYKAQLNKADYLKKRKEIKEQEQKEIKDKIAKYKAESKKKYLEELRQQELEKKKQIKLKEKELIEKEKQNKRRLLVKEKGINNPSFNLFNKKELSLHKDRLERFKKSKWRNVMYYKGSKGGIYTINEKGTRNYKY